MIELVDRFSKWAISKHVNTNHFYDKYLPYEFHLRMVAHAASNNLFQESITVFNEVLGVHEDLSNTILQCACYGHDLIEDTRTSYNDITTFLTDLVQSKLVSHTIAEIIFAVTNNTGRNRKERADAAYYEKIRNQPGAIFIKLCDRIANVQYSIMTGSKMGKMYLKEHESFKNELYSKEYDSMFGYLENLLKQC